MSLSMSWTHTLRTANCGLPVNCFLLRMRESPSTHPPKCVNSFHFLNHLMDRDNDIYHLF